MEKSQRLGSIFTQAEGYEDGAEVSDPSPSLWSCVQVCWVAGVLHVALIFPPELHLFYRYCRHCCGFSSLSRLSSPGRMQFLTKISVRRHIRDSVYCNQGHIYVVFDVKGVCASCEDLQYGWTGSIGTKRKLEDSDDDERLANWKREQKMLEWIFDGLL